MRKSGFFFAGPAVNLTVIGKSFIDCVVFVGRTKRVSIIVQEAKRCKAAAFGGAGCEDDLLRFAVYARCDDFFCSCKKALFLVPLAWMLFGFPTSPRHTLANSRMDEESTGDVAA